MGRFLRLFTARYKEAFMNSARNENAPTPVVVHVPHASIFVPEEMRRCFKTPDFEAERLRMTDWYCDELFDSGHAMAVFPISRLACDAERFRDDGNEPMAAVGMGAVYTGMSDGSALREVTAGEREAILRRFYDPHHAELAGLVGERLRRFGCCVIIDGHSFHPAPLPYEADQSPDRPDVCIGTDRFHTPPALADAAAEFFRAAGYSVGFNRPFAGALVPAQYFNKDLRVRAVMVELNRRLYMDENAGKTDGFESIKTLLGQFSDTLALSAENGRI
jgi:N-formylglutamate deformylase